MTPSPGPRVGQNRPMIFFYKFRLCDRSPPSFPIWKLNPLLPSYAMLGLSLDFTFFFEVTSKNSTKHIYVSYSKKSKAYWKSFLFYCNKNIQTRWKPFPSSIKNFSFFFSWQRLRPAQEIISNGCLFFLHLEQG